MDATAFSGGDRHEPEPLCAIYEPGTLADFAAGIAAGGSPSPKSWLANAWTHTLVIASGQALHNVNTQDDLQSLRPDG